MTVSQKAALYCGQEKKWKEINVKREGTQTYAEEENKVSKSSGLKAASHVRRTTGGCQKHIKKAQTQHAKPQIGNPVPSAGVTVNEST